MKKNLKSLVLGGVMSLTLLFGCAQRIVTKTEESSLMQENGQVADTLYNKGYHKKDVDLQPRYDIINGGFNIALTTTEIKVPETWGIVFRCDHGNKFAIQGSQQKYKTLFEKLDNGMKVIIDYTEIRRNTYEDIDGDGIKDLTKSEVIDYNFIDANPVIKKIILH